MFEMALTGGAANILIVLKYIDLYFNVKVKPRCLISKLAKSIDIWAV